jgi:hypothetical protein
MQMNRILLGFGVALLLAMAIPASTLVATGFMHHEAFADPWSWGGHPSHNWLKCYYSGSSDCSDLR